MIEEYLRNRNVDFEVDQHELAYTAQEEAAAEDVTGYEFAKTVIVTDGENCYMLVLPAPYRVDLDKVSEVIGCEVHLADEDEIEKLFSDCEVGAEPPFGSIFHIDTYMDESMRDRDEIVFRADTHEKVVKMAVQDYESLENPTVADIRVGL
ncbi:MAG: aminoacyl-tRNA deacylase [Planctomycetota bacterium]